VWDTLKLADYPLWVRAIGCVWAVTSAVLAVALMYAKPKSSQTDSTSQIIATRGANSPVVVAGANSQVSVNVGDNRNEVRPWITVANVSVIDNPVRVGALLRVQILFRNTGTSPASNVRAQSVAEVLTAGRSPAFNYERYPTNGSPVMGPGTELAAIVVPTRGANGSAVGLLREGFDGLVARTILIFAHGRVTYEDVHGREHWTDFCHTFFLRPNGESGWNPADQHNAVDRD